MPQVKHKFVKDPDLVTAMTRADIACLMDVKPEYINHWVEKGAPAPIDRMYNFHEFFPWYVEYKLSQRATGDKLKEEKLEQEIKKLTLKNQESEGKTIPTALKEEIVCDRARSLSKFLPRALKENTYAMAGKTVEELNVIVNEIAIQAMEAYTGIRRD